MPIDLLFSDIVMPGSTDGYALAAEGKRCRPALKVLLTSGFAANWDEPGGQSAGGILAKPYRLKELAVRLREALDAA